MDQDATGHLLQLHSQQLTVNSWGTPFFTRTPDLSHLPVPVTFRDDNKSSGFTVVVDAQKSSWRVTRTHLRYVNTCLKEHLQDLLVIRPDTFWDTQHVVDNCAKSHKRGEVNKCQLHNYHYRVLQMQNVDYLLVTTTTFLTLLLSSLLTCSLMSATATCASGRLHFGLTYIQLVFQLLSSP